MGSSIGLFTYVAIIRQQMREPPLTDPMAPVTTSNFGSYKGPDQFKLSKENLASQQQFKSSKENLSRSKENVNKSKENMNRSKESLNLLYDDAGGDSVA